MRKDDAAPVARTDAVLVGSLASASVAILLATPQVACAALMDTQCNHAL